jgi:hypothetical protein
MSGMNMTVERWVAMDKRGFVLCVFSMTPYLSYHLGDLQYRILRDFSDVISSAKKKDIMVHIKRWNKECYNDNAAKCKAVKIRITLEIPSNGK